MFLGANSHMNKFSQRNLKSFVESKYEHTWNNDKYQEDSECECH